MASETSGVTRNLFFRIKNGKQQIDSLASLLDEYLPYYALHIIQPYMDYRTSTNMLHFSR